MRMGRYTRGDAGNPVLPPHRTRNSCAETMRNAGARDGRLLHPAAVNRIGSASRGDTVVAVLATSAAIVAAQAPAHSSSPS